MKQHPHLGAARFRASDGTRRHFECEAWETLNALLVFTQREQKTWDRRSLAQLQLLVHEEVFSFVTEVKKNKSPMTFAFLHRTQTAVKVLLVRP